MSLATIKTTPPGICPKCGGQKRSVAFLFCQKCRRLDRVHLEESDSDETPAERLARLWCHRRWRGEVGHTGRYHHACPLCRHEWTDGKQYTPCPECGYGELEAAAMNRIKLG